MTVDQIKNRSLPAAEPEGDFGGVQDVRVQVSITVKEAIRIEGMRVSVMLFVVQNRPEGIRGMIHAGMWHITNHAFGIMVAPLGMR